MSPSFRVKLTNAWEHNTTCKVYTIFLQTPETCEMSSKIEPSTNSTFPLSHILSLKKLQAQTASGGLGFPVLISNLPKHWFTVDFVKVFLKVTSSKHENKLYGYPIGSHSFAKKNTQVLLFSGSWWLLTPQSSYSSPFHDGFSSRKKGVMAHQSELPRQGPWDPSHLRWSWEAKDTPPSIATRTWKLDLIKRIINHHLSSFIP